MKKIIIVSIVFMLIAIIVAVVMSRRKQEKMQDMFMRGKTRVNIGDTKDSGSGTDIKKLSSDVQWSQFITFCASQKYVSINKLQTQMAKFSAIMTTTPDADKIADIPEEAKTKAIAYLEKVKKAAAKDKKITAFADKVIKAIK